MNHTAFMLRNGTKCAAAEATAHDVDREADHFPSGYFGLAVMPTRLISITWMRATGVGQIEHVVHFGRCQRNRRRRHPHIACGLAFAVCLNQGTRVTRVGLKVQHTIRVRIQHRVALDLLIRRQPDHAAFTRWRLDAPVGRTLQRRVGNEVQGLDHHPCRGQSPTL